MKNSKLKVIFFDVNETMLDLEPMRKSVGQVLNGREELLSYWFSKMLHYSLVSTLIGNYQDFGEVGIASLLMIAEENHIELDYERAKKAIIPSLLNLPPHQDVIGALRELKKLDVKLATLTNSSNYGVNTQLENAKMTNLFDDILSIEDVGMYKPHKSTYLWAAEKMNVKVEEAMLVAAHGWDIAGAKASGMQTTFIARPGKSLYSLSGQPDYIVKDFSELVILVKNLLKKERA